MAVPVEFEDSETVVPEILQLLLPLRCASTVMTTESWPVRMVCAAVVNASELHAAAATYGPTNGPPAPTGAAPVGWMKSMPVSARARAMLMRPLPVWSWVPAGSAMRARRPTMTPLLRVGSTAFMNAAAPATIAADAEVPLMMV